MRDTVGGAREPMSDVLLWTPEHGSASVGRPTRTHIQQLCIDIGWGLENRPEAMDDRDEWRDTVREISASCVSWWWWWYVTKLLSYLYIRGWAEKFIGWNIQGLKSSQAEKIVGWKAHRLKIQSFPSPRLIASPRLTNRVCPTIYP